jgi:hypothetical protein
VAELDALQAKVDALLPAILLSSPRYDATSNLAFKGEL